MQQKKTILQQIIPHTIAIVCFLIITFGYFSPLLEGRSLPQNDVMQYKGVSHELSDYYYKEGHSSEWTGSLFSGMPAYQIGVWGGSPNFLDYLETPLKSLGSSSAGAVFTGMLMAYILFCLMGVGTIPAILGAIAYSLSSYNIIIIDAGHVTKAWAIAYMPLVIAGITAAFQKKFLHATLLMGLGLALQLKANHLQITYYTAILCVFLYAGLIINSILKKEISSLFKSSIALLIGVIMAIFCNIGSLYANYEMAQESIRGKSELTQPTQNEKQSSGLDKDYAFAWSYGKAETFSLLIPNIYGGASGGLLSTKSNLYTNIRSQAPSAQLDPQGIQAQTYWGDQPFTSGPVYFGSIVCFLFILGIFLIKSPVKWVLLTATLFFIFLSWGRNFEVFNNWFFYHFPMYNKFRAVSTALVIPALTMLIIAIWGIKEFISDTIELKKRQSALYISFGITVGVCFLLWIFPSIFGLNFTSNNDQQWIGQVPQWYYTALIADRKDLLSSDALRSIFFIAFAFVLLFISLKVNKEKKQWNTYLLIGLTLLITTDLWSIDRRYLDTDKFKSRSTYNVNQPFAMTNADKTILQDKQLSYRVFNLNNPFNETSTSYYHKSIGGYHAAKLKRYQELIDYHLQNELTNITNSFASQNIDSIIASFSSNTAMNMLNTKYIIFDPQHPPLTNPYAMGNAWFVSDYKFVDNADQEIAAIGSFDIHNIAVLDKKFSNELSEFTITPDSTASIELTEYKPNKLKYKSSAQYEQLAVFSEIYYNKGWEAYIDGRPITHVRANWTLRAMRIPVGNHEIEFRFIPHAYNTARTVSTISSALMLLLLIGNIGSIFYKYKNK